MADTEDKYRPLDHQDRRRHQEDQKLADSGRRMQEADDIKWLMSLPQGRRVVNRILARCGVYRSSFTGNSETFFREGERNIGLFILAEVQGLCPDDFVKMLKESNDDRSSQ